MKSINQSINQSINNHLNARSITTITNQIVKTAQTFSGSLSSVGPYLIKCDVVIRRNQVQHHGGAALPSGPLVRWKNHLEKYHLPGKWRMEWHRHGLSRLGSRLGHGLGLCNEYTNHPSVCPSVHPPTHSSETKCPMEFNQFNFSSSDPATTTYPFNSTQTFLCTDGYQIPATNETTQVSTCSDVGVWSPELIACVG